ncbi:MAG: hypothetical protein IKG82_03960 [Oscillospiraceae bacterium]|nr:hypothetical protein [Oscillospiraceae bacterium]
MALLDMFDKLDDIVYKPVESICDWIHEPLRRMEHKRNLQVQRNIADIEAEKERQQVELDALRDREAAALRADERKWNAEIDQFINEQEDARRDKLVAAVKQYQLELAAATKDIVESIGLMSLEMRSRANDLVLEKTKAYQAIQDQAKKQSVAELKEAQEMFSESDPETYRMLVSDIMSERRNMVETAGKFIVELSEDLKRLNQNSDLLMAKGMDAVMDSLSPLTAAIGTTVASSQSAIDMKMPEKPIIEITAEED